MIYLKETVRNTSRLESLPNAHGRTLCLQNIVCITHAFLNVFVHPALSRQKIVSPDFPYILVCPCRILNAHERSSVRTTNFPIWKLGMCRIPFFRIEPDSSSPDIGQKKIITGHRIVNGYRMLTRYSGITTISLLETQHF